MIVSGLGYLQLAWIDHTYGHVHYVHQAHLYLLPDGLEPEEKKTILPRSKMSLLTPFLHE